MTRLRVALCVGLGAVLAGCSGTELLAGGQRAGEVSAVATDGEAPATARAERDGRSLSRAPAAALLRGTVEFIGSVAVAQENGGWIPITDGLATVRLRLAEPDTALLGRERVPAALYSRARVSFARVSVDVTEGLVIGGIPLSGLFRVEIGAEPLVVEAPITMLVREDGRSTLVVDLNAAVWLGAADPLSRTVSAAAFQAAVEVSAR